jgi:imidazolonepropionase-like amidohydrolase
MSITEIRCQGVYDPSLGQVLDVKSIELMNGRVVQMRSQPIVNGSRQMRILDMTEFIVMPGLIESHAHLCFDSTVDDCVGQLSIDSDNDLFEKCLEHAKMALRKGITTIRDLGDRSFQAVRLGKTGRSVTGLLPNIIGSGPPVTSAGGHCHFLGGAVDGAEEIQQALESARLEGAGVVKVMVTGGILTHGSDLNGLQFSASLLKEIVAHSRKFGLICAAHAHTANGIAASLEAGFDTIEHCTFASADEFDLDASVFNQLVQSQAWVCPTFVERPGVLWDEERLSWRRKVLLELYESGVKLIAGTDSGVLRNLHHDSLPWCIESMANAGIPKSEVLKMATINGAEALQLSGRGRLGAGSVADLIALRTDPSEDLTVLQAPAMVMVSGELVDR